MDPESSNDEQPDEPTRRLAYALVDDTDTVVGLTVVEVPVSQFGAERDRLDAAHTDPGHRVIDESAELPNVGDRLGA